MIHLYILAGSCFPNCHPPPGSGWSMNDGSSTGLGFLAILGAVLLIKKVFWG